MTLDDLLSKAGGGDGLRTLARHYGLSEADADRMVAAFTPAFQTGLQSAMADPAALFQLMSRLATENLERFYKEPESAFAGAGLRESQELMERIFRSEDVRRALAEQMSAATGLAQAVTREMMPALTAIALGGIERNARENPLLSAMLDQMRALSGGRPSGTPRAEVPRAEKGPLDRYEDEQAEKSRSDAARLAGAFADNPFVKAYGEMMRAGTAAALDPSNPFMAASKAGTPPQSGEGAGADPAAASAAAGQALFGNAIESSRRLGEAYQRAIESILASGSGSGSGVR
ncbi:DUF937 domain-containing protein [Faunimonas sp. B44]|uniref:DUF937 domain-containing protein n=1 Tax=Faunimonas sp. B44 TaxID=3461493 RepID=UPI004044A059